MDDQYTTERDSFGRLLADRQVWRQAASIPAAGELTARWLEGRSQYQPGTFTPVIDAETSAIAAELAALNRNGLFTKESQPGLHEAGSSQRAYVTGFCTPETAGGLLELSSRTDYVAVGHAPGEMSRAAIPVTVQDGEIVTVLGTSESPIEADQLKDWADEANESLALVLAESWYVEILDPVWGRQGMLLPAVMEALGAIGGQ